MAPLSYRQWSGVAVLAVIIGGTASRFAVHATQASLNALQPEAMPGSKAVLNYGGQLVNVDVVYKLSNGSESIDLVRGGDVFEHEGYVRTKSSFELVDADGEHFQPPLPLLSAESSAPWSGELVSGGISHPSTATVEVTEDKVRSHPIDIPATLATVKLQLDSGGPKKADRTLKFWFAKGRGVIAREFEMGVKRSPAD